jgi:1-acyl-sn-glycerol-3-phosphate acyltransferase
VIVVPRAPDPTAAEIARALRAFRAVGKRAVRAADLDARDPAFARDALPLLGLLYDRVWRCETEFEDDLPEGPSLVVGNHNAMTGMPDMFCHMAAFWRRYGTEREAFGLMHDLPFHTPLAGAWLQAAGAIAARPEVASKALDRGATVLVFPGGDLDACKPSRDRYRIDFGSRRGYVRLALRRQVPIVPLVSAGAHESLWIWSDGRRIAEWLGLPRRARSNVFPIGLALPLGLVFGVPYPHWPLPVKIHTRVLRAMRLEGSPADADDPAVVEREHERVVATLQGAMDDLRAEGRHGLFPRGPAAREASRPAAPARADRPGSHPS